MIKKLWIILTILLLATPLWAQLSGPVPDPAPPTGNPQASSDPEVIIVDPGPAGPSSIQGTPEQAYKDAKTAQGIMRDNFKEDLKELYIDYKEEIEGWQEEIFNGREEDKKKINDEYLEKMQALTKQESAIQSDTQDKRARKKIRKKYKKMKKKLATQRKGKMLGTKLHWNGKKNQSKKASKEKYKAARKAAYDNFNRKTQRPVTESDEYKVLTSQTDI